MNYVCVYMYMHVNTNMHAHIHTQGSEHDYIHFVCFFPLYFALGFFFFPHHNLNTGYLVIRG